MALSLQEQLLKAGVADKKAAKANKDSNDEQAPTKSHVFVVDFKGASIIKSQGYAHIHRVNFNGPSTYMYKLYMYSTFVSSVKFKFGCDYLSITS